ncbi:hypothetical protein F2P81_024391 [Scophthalmus maximus]|uniref:Uncharacterized protein n=1 Tax=Scophthalmus maximus TaxID=52904 RepID=A0A6A4RXG3_SCOMX|nr:hypothetical protein F2P81_024391 [Scophthalmus maximus]
MLPGPLPGELGLRPTNDPSPSAAASLFPAFTTASRVASLRRSRRHVYTSVDAQFTVFVHNENKVDIDDYIQSVWSRTDSVQGNATFERGVVVEKTRAKC